jgi:glc operon protein GlcG
MIVEKNLSHEDALVAINVLKNEITKRKKAAVIAVSDSHGELIGLLHLDKAAFSSITIATNKAYTAARERKPSRQIGNSVRDPEKGYDIAYFGDKRFTGWGGGIPVVVDGEVIGAVAVSGLPEQEDMELAQIGVDAILANNSTSLGREK